MNEIDLQAYVWKQLSPYITGLRQVMAGYETLGDTSSMVRIVVVYTGEENSVALNWVKDRLHDWYGAETVVEVTAVRVWA